VSATTTPATIGDTITTADQLDALPTDTVILDAHDEVHQRHGHVTTPDGDYSAWLGVMPPTLKVAPDVALPAMVLHVPVQPCQHCGSCDGPPSCPDCDHTDNARAEAWAAAIDHVQPHLSNETYRAAHADNPHRRPFEAQES